MDTLTLRAIAADTIVYSISSIRDSQPLVQSIQTILNRIGLSIGVVNGDWNYNTDTAYRTFARKYNFAVDELSPKAAGLLLSLATTQPPRTPSSPPAPSPKPAPDPKPIPSPPSVLEEALRFTLRWEGGYVNHPADRGGETNKGVTTATYRGYRQRKGLPVQSVRAITDAEVREIYESQYWIPAQCSVMQRPLAIVHFDTAINFGVGGAAMFLQDLLNVSIDRSIGPITRAAIAKADHASVARRYCQARIDYRYRRVNADPTQQVFLRGWLNRDNALLQLISSLK